MKEKFERKIIELFIIVDCLLFTDMSKKQIIVALVIVLISNLAGMIYSAVSKKKENKKKRNIKRGSFRPKKTNFKKKGGKK